jgi:hypothetical protein
MMHLLPRITFVSRSVDQLKKMFLIQQPYDSLIVKRPCVKFLQVLSQNLSVRPNLIFFSLICRNKTYLIQPIFEQVFMFTQSVGIDQTNVFIITNA